MTGPLLRFADRVDRGTTRIAAGASWLQPLLVVAVLVSVLLRYGLGRGSIQLEELQWHLLAATVLLGLAGTYAEDAHVRVDLFRGRLSPRGQAWVELLGSLLLLLPFATIVTFWSMDFLARSWRMAERSPMPSGLPARWGIKAVFLLGMALLLFQALAVAARSLARLRER